jgi:dolichol kinase
MSQTVLPPAPKRKRTAANLGREAGLSPAEESRSILLDWPVFRTIAAKIGVYELRRRMVHMSPVLLPFALWVIPHRDPWGPILLNAVMLLATVLTGLTLYRFRTIARRHDEHGLDAVIGYAVPILMLVLLLPGRAELAVMTLGIVALGDGSATLGGLWFGGPRLPWNSRKTLSGMLSFIVCGTTMATIIYWGEARPGVSWNFAIAVTFASTLAAAFVESLPFQWNDNFRVGTTAALVGSFVQIVGFGR